MAVNFLTKNHRRLVQSENKDKLHQNSLKPQPWPGKWENPHIFLTSDEKYIDGTLRHF